MSLDGLRAWIGLVEQKLAKRTRVFLVLVAIAIGGAGAALYLAIDAQDSAVSESDLERVREELTGTGGDAAGVAALQGEIEALRAQVEALQEDSGSAGGGGKGGGSQGGGTGGGDDGGTGGSGGGGTGNSGAGAGATPGGLPLPDGGAAPQNQKELRELVEKAQQEAEAAK
jgi:hypothetical protein